MGLIAVLLLSCEPESDIKQLRIDLFHEGSSSYSTAATAGSYLTSRILYKDFNVNNYPAATSIIFMAKISIAHPNHECMASLVSIEDSVIIEGSALSTDSQGLVWVESENILDSFPDKDIDLKVYLKPSLGGVEAKIDAAYLYIRMD